MNSLSSMFERFAWWQRASPRERAALAIGGAVIVVAFFVSVVIVPLRDTLAHAPQDRAQRKALLAQARDRLAAIQTVKASVAPPVDARGAIERALDGQHIGRADATIDTTNDRISLTLPAVRIADAAAIVAALAHAGLRVSAATLAARADTSDVRSELTFIRSTP